MVHEQNYAEGHSEEPGKEEGFICEFLVRYVRDDDDDEFDRHKTNRAMEFIGGSP